jgi:hypothetical protein
MCQKNENNLGAKFLQIPLTIKNSALEVCEAIKGGHQGLEADEKSTDATQLRCISKGVLDFNLVESDIQHMHNQLNLDEVEVLGICLTIFQEAEYLVEIQAYLQKHGKTFKQVAQAKVSNITHLPGDVALELKTTRKVTVCFEV